MPLDDARQLQAVIDRALQNGNELGITQLADRFGINRDRVRQAMELRRRGHDLCGKPPAGFSTVSRKPGMAYWPTLEKPSKP
jgi:hypothetical protein